MKNFVAALLVLTVFACGRGAEVDSAEDADESVTVASAESSLTSELGDEVSQPISAAPNDLAAAAAARVGSHLKPAGCLTTTVNGATVTYVFNDCTGPYGLVHVTGTVVGVYSRNSSGAVQAVFTGKGVKVNASTVDLNSTVVSTLNQGQRTSAVTSESSAVGPRGITVARTGNYTVIYEPSAECITVDGTWTTKALERMGSTVVKNYKRCKGQCPAAGGTIEHTSARRTVTVTYDGSNVAKWSTSGGRSGTINLRCGS